MKYIDNLDELNRLVEESEEPIVYPVREEGIIFLDYFRYTNELYRYSMEFSKFLCIAKETLPAGFAQRTIQKLPVIPLKNLVHFRDTADFFIAAPKEQVDYISNLIKNFGCKNVFVCSDEIFKQMKNKIDELEKSGHIRDWYRNYLIKKFEDIDYRIDEQLEVRDTNTKAFAEYRNAFYGKKVVIVGCGPTLKYYKPVEAAIHIGLNFAWTANNVKLNYLFAHDGGWRFGFNSLNLADSFDKITDKIFIGKHLDRDTGYRMPESFSLNRKVVRDFISNDGRGQLIHQDICYHPLKSFGSVVFTALHFSLFAYPEKIYLVGCDTTSTGHFYDKKTNNDYDLATGIVKVGYARMKMFAEQHYPDTEIISINPVGLKGLFTDVYTDEYKASLNK